MLELTVLKFYVEISITSLEMPKTSQKVLSDT